MQVKKFEAPTMQEALKVIKRELGPEAIILSTKENRKGFGLMSKNSIEVTAAISEKDLKKKMLAEKNLPQETKEKIWNSPANQQADVYNTYFERQLKATATAEKTRPVEPKRIEDERTQIAKEPASRAAARPFTEQRYADIEDEQMADAPSKRGRLNISVPAFDKGEKVKSLERDIEQLKSVIADMSKTQASTLQASEVNENFFGIEQQNEFLQELTNAGIEKRFARELVKKVLFEMTSEEQNDHTHVQEKLAGILMDEIQVANLLAGVGARSGNGKTSVVALVGPTGVGKTTTIAKIASKAILEGKHRVGLINLDSYKVAAADQLATYARIMGVPFRSVSSVEEFQQAVYDFSSLDLVLVDTTGRSQKDQENLLQLRHVLGTIENMRTVLMVSATTRDSDMNDVLSRFKVFDPVGLVFSKLDETGVYGSIYNAQKRTGLPLLYFTVGQRVPEDIEVASKERVVDLVLDL